MGEKTPENILCLDIINSLFPSARMVVVLRNPIAIWGSKKERFLARGLTLDQFCKSIIAFSGFLARARSSGAHIVKYERLLSTPSDEMHRVFDYLGIRHNHSFVREGIQYGSYSKYVGSSLSKDRNNHNLSMVTSEESTQIECLLGDFMDEYKLR